MKGTKRFIAVDTNGLLLRVAVLSAKVQDWDELLDLCLLTHPLCPRVTAGWVDQGFKAGVAAVHERYGWALNVVSKLPDQRGFQVQPRRWVVERTLAWLGQYRRLTVRYERLANMHLAFLTLACAFICWKRLSRPT